MLEWNWDEKCGEAVFVETLKGVEAKHTYNMYTGNAYMLFINEWTEPDGTERYDVCSFWLDKDHMKNCLGLNKKGGHTKNIHYDSRKFKLNKAKCRYWKQIVQALAEAYDDVEIELYTEK